VILCNSHGSFEREYEEARMLRQRGVEGLVIEHLGSADYLFKLREAGYPFVLLDRCPEAPWADYVTFDDVEGGFLATQALIDAGRTKIAHIAGPESSLVAQDRLAGFRLALKTAGVPENPDWVIHAGGFEDHRPGLDCAQKLFDLPDRPDAVFCFDDFLALGVLQAAAERGLRVPQDLAVIGYNDASFCPWTAIPLASVHVDTAELGRQAGQLLLEKIENGSDRVKHQEIKIPPKVVNRASLDGKS
jgi:LacI family transcriptional regulator